MTPIDLARGYVYPQVVAAMGVDRVDRVSQPVGLRGKPTARPATRTRQISQTGLAHAPAWSILTVVANDMEAAVARMVKRGSTHDDAARLLLARGLGPIPAIKALRNGAQIPLGSAKEIVHRNLSEAQQQSAEALWDMLDELFANEPRDTPGQP